VVNLLTGHEHAAEAERLVRDFPELPVVLDHCLGLQTGAEVGATLAALARLAKYSNVHAKLSSIANGPSGCEDGFPCRGFQRAMLDVIEMFGPERCCWGAHFPLEKYSPRLTYEQHLRIYTEELPLSSAARAQIVGGTANRLWFGGRLREGSA
jgi:predicted TIM-barrel fold metal-dependent hydrolase